MRVSITDRSGALDEQLRDFAERRLRFALSRFHSKVQYVRMVISDENGPRGGPDKCCRVTVTLRPGGKLTVSSSDVELPACVARAAERMGRRLARAIDMQQQFDRSRLAVPESEPAAD